VALRALLWLVDRRAFNERDPSAGHQAKPITVLQICRRRHHGGALLVLVEVEQVAAAVGEHRVDATVIPPPGFLDEHHPVGLEPLGLRLAVVGA
jgi:hypothetical protein